MRETLHFDAPFEKHQGMNPIRLRRTDPGSSSVLRGVHGVHGVTARSLLWALLWAPLWILLWSCTDPGEGAREKVATGQGSLGREETRLTPLRPSKSRSQRPDRRIAFSEGCSTSECHAEYGQEKVLHAPLKEDDCRLCHLEDQGGHIYPVIPGVEASCRDCHATGHAALHPHGEASELTCLDCHLPHAGSKGLLRSSGIRTLCAQCHDPGLGRYEHRPFARDDCFLCHTKHGAENAAQRLSVFGTKPCASCHESQSVGFSSGAASGHGQLTKACLTCHNVHVSDDRNLLRFPSKEGCTICHEHIGMNSRRAGHPHGALQTGKECLNCHDPHDSRRPHMLRADQGTVCLSCHDKEILTQKGRRIRNMALAIREGRFSHGPVREGDCSTCHEVHGSQRAGLLRRVPEGLAQTADAQSFSLCFACHDRNLVVEEVTTTSTQFRNGDQNLHYLHIKEGKHGRPCTECHQVHGGSLPRHMAESVRFQGSDYRMTIGFQLRDKGGTCRPGCHEELPYDRSSPRRLETPKKGRKKRLKNSPKAAGKQAAGKEGGRELRRSVDKEGGRHP